MHVHLETGYRVLVETLLVETLCAGLWVDSELGSQKVNTHSELKPGEEQPTCGGQSPIHLTYSHASRQRAELEADYSSVCLCVPLLGEAQNLRF